jgi:uncharacterized Fe-S cluster-containing radical SAM superfamily protein
MYDLHIHPYFIQNPIEKKVRCTLINDTLSLFNTQDVTFCRGGRLVKMTEMPFCRWSEPAETIDEFLRIRADIDKQNNEQTDSAPCYGCPLLKKTCWNPIYRINNIVFCTTPTSICNFKCTYCYSGLYGNAENQKNKNPYADRAAIIAELEIRKLASPERTTVHWSDGEISVEPRRYEAFAIAEKYKSIFYTNASVYSKEIASLMRRKDAIICVSIDAGTPETFKKIKGVDAYEKVCDNLLHYAEDSSAYKIWLKYLFMYDINASDEDLDGFIDYCIKLRPGLIILTNDLNIGYSPISYDNLMKLFHVIDALLTAELNITTEDVVTYTLEEKKTLYGFAVSAKKIYTEKLKIILGLDHEV